MEILRILNYPIKLELFTLQIIMFAFFFLPNKLQSQTIQTESLFELYRGTYQKNIGISERIQEQWNLPNYFLQHIHYNANKDSRVDSARLIRQVLFLYYKKNNPDLNTLELLDDGKHFDNEPNDGIYGNYLSEDFDKLKTDEAFIDVQLDTIRINYFIIQPPVNYLPAVPKIIAPLHKSVVSTKKPVIYWEIDPNADGYGIILLGSTPILGEELKDIIWEKEFRTNKDGLFTEKVPVPLVNRKGYTVIIWSYTNTKLINNEWNKGAYSIEWSQFYVDTLKKNNEEFILSQNFPNPFNSRTVIKYNLHGNGKISINIYDIIGRKITTLLSEEQSAGEHYILWNGRNNLGYDIASGIYFYNIIFNGLSITKKMILAK